MMHGISRNDKIRGKNNVAREINKFRKNYLPFLYRILHILLANKLTIINPDIGAFE
jgi:hypothetical protein